MATPVLQFKRGNAGVAGTVPALRPGEPAISLNNFDFFIGIDTSVANNKFFGSHRYWGRENGTNSLRLKLVDKDGTNHIAIAASDTLSGVATYRLPNTTNGSSGDFLKLKSSSGGYYDLEWASVPSGGSFSIVGDTGTDTFGAGETLTFAGTASEIETTVTNNQVQIGLPNNVVVGGALTVTTGAVIDGVQIGINGANVIDTVSGNLTLNSAGGQTIIDDAVTIQNNLTVNGTVTVGGTVFSVVAQEILVANKDIVLGYTTSQSPNDDTANHAGVAIASTVGSPLVNFSVSGINTLPDTYKQLMWFKSGTLGFSTDAFAFNYGVAIGTTTMANGTRLAVGTGITITDTAISATTVNATTGNFTNISGNLTGTISTATRAQTVDTTTAPSGTFYPGLFVNNTGTASTAVYVDSGISYVSNTDTLTLTGDVAINGGDATTTATTFNLVNGTATSVNFAGAATALVMGAATGIATINNATLTLPNATTVNVNGANPTLASSSTGLLTLFNTNLTRVNAFGAATALVMGAATGITTVSNNLTIGGDIRVNGNDIQASDGNTNITLASNTLTTFAGDIRVNGNDIQASDGTVAITLAGNDVTVADDLTVQGNLYVNGSTTQVNTAALTVEDRTIDLGVVNGAAPAATTTWDLGVLFNYNSSGAKKSAVIWEHADTRFKFASVLDSDTNGSTVDTPQLTVTTFAPIEIGQLWVTDCAGTSQVISCTGTTRNLENITVDAGTF